MGAPHHSSMFRGTSIQKRSQASVRRPNGSPDTTPKTFPPSAKHSFISTLKDALLAMYVQNQRVVPLPGANVPPTDSHANWAGDFGALNVPPCAA